MPNRSVELFLSYEDLLSLQELADAHAGGDRSAWLSEQIHNAKCRLRQERIARRTKSMHELHTEIHMTRSKVYSPAETRALIQEICDH